MSFGHLRHVVGVGFGVGVGVGVVLRKEGVSKVKHEERRPEAATK